MHITQAQQRYVIGFAGFCPHRVAQEQQHVHLAAADHGSDLLCAAAATRVQAAHRQTGGVPYHLGGNAGGDQVMFR